MSTPSNPLLFLILDDHLDDHHGHDDHDNDHDHCDDHENDEDSLLQPLAIPHFR